MLLQLTWSVCMIGFRNFNLVMSHTRPEAVELETELGTGAAIVCQRVGRVICRGCVVHSTAQVLCRSWTTLVCPQAQHCGAVVLQHCEERLSRRLLLSGNNIYRAVAAVLSPQHGAHSTARPANQKLSTPILVQSHLLMKQTCNCWSTWSVNIQN